MKHFISGMMVTLALVLAIVMGVVALAETAEPEVELPGVEEAAPETTAPTDSASDSAALQDALKAYAEAKQSERMDSLEAELNGYVASGKLTQAQADLILKYYKDRESLRNGVCPDCGYQFGNGGMGGRMNGGRGGRGGKGGMRGFDRQPMNGQNGVQGQSNVQGQADGMALEGGWQTLPAFDADEGI